MMKYLHLIFTFILLEVSVDGQGFQANHRHGGEKDRGERQPNFDVSQWYRGPRESLGATRPPTPNVKPPNIHSPVLHAAKPSESPYYHPASGQRSRSIDPWRSTFPQSPFYVPAPTNYKPLGSPLDDFQRDLYNDEYFRQKGVPLNAQRIQEIAPGIAGKVIYTADSLESLETKINKGPQPGDRNTPPPPIEKEKFMVSSTERQLLQILGHVSSNTHLDDTVQESPSKTKHAHHNAKAVTDDQSEIVNDDDSKQNAVSDRSVSREDNEDAESDEDKSEDTEDEETKGELNEKDGYDENPDDFSLEETSSKSPTLVAATGIPPRWTKLPLLPPATPPAAKRGSFYNGNVQIDTDHHNTHHRPDHGLSAASVFARIKPHIKGDALPKQPLPPNPRRPTTPHIHHHHDHEESEEDYENDYSDEETEDYHQHASNQTSLTRDSNTTIIPVTPVTTEKPKTTITITPTPNENSTNSADTPSVKTRVKTQQSDEHRDTKPMINFEDDDTTLPLMKTFKNVNLKEVKNKDPQEPFRRTTENDKPFKKASREGKITETLDNSVGELENEQLLVSASTAAPITEDATSTRSTDESDEVVEASNENTDAEAETKDEEETSKEKIELPISRDESTRDTKKNSSEGKGADPAKTSEKEIEERNKTPKPAAHRIVTISIKPGDIKALLQTSEGDSLSEILQSHGLSLPEFLRNGLRIAKKELIADITNTTADVDLTSTTTTTTVPSITTSPIAALQPSSGRPAFDMSKIKPVSISELLKGKVDLKKPSNILAAIFDKTSTHAPLPVSTTTVSTTTELSKWSTKAKVVTEEPKERGANTDSSETADTVSNADSKADNSEVTTQVVTSEATTFTTKKVLKPYSPPAGIGEYGVFEAGRGNSYGHQRPIQRTRTEGRTNRHRANKTRPADIEEDDDSVEIDTEAVTLLSKEATTVIVIEEEETERTKFIDIPVEIRGAIIASSAIGGFALVVFLVIFIILWKRNRKVQAGVRASHLIRRAIEHATSGGGDSETSSTSDTIFNATTGYRKNGFWGTLGRSVWK